MSDNLEPWIPYMGNKSRLLDRIHGTLSVLDIPRFDTFVDLFCGGGSVGYSMVPKGVKIIMNDIDPGLIALHKTIRDDPERLFFFEKMKAPTKEMFNLMKQGCSDYDTFNKFIYSFSTNGKAYLWGETRLNTPPEQLNRQRTEPRERMRHLDDINALYGRYWPDITFLNQSYDEVEIPQGALVFCDPPYRNTAGYSSGDFDHERFYAWCLACENIVLISEYDMPSDFYLLDEYSLASQGGGNKNTKDVVERLYSNKPIRKLTLF